MLLSFVCVKIQWIVYCRWIRAPADACFVQSVKHDKLDFRALALKRTSNSYNISSFWICSIKVDKCLRTYYKLSWKYLNTAKIISKVTITLSLINSNIDFDFVGWVIKPPCVFYFRSVKFHCVKETHDINSLFFDVGESFSSIPAQKNNQTNLCQDLLTIEDTDSDLKVHALHYANELLVLAFQKLLQTRQASRNNKKICKKGFWLWLYCTNSVRNKWENIR